MDMLNLNHLIKSKAPISLTEVEELGQLLNKYPYFHLARALQLKGLKTNFDIRYNQELKTTAAHTIDRSVLFDYITSTNFVVFVPKNQPEERNTEQKIDSTSNIDAEQLFNQNTEMVKANKQLSIGQPINFSVNDTYSFNEWLQLTKVVPLNQTCETNKKSNQNSLIDTFINTNPKIKAPEKDAPLVDVSSKAVTPNESLMTETLAKVYLEQKKYKSAIKAYKILSLKYPEKSGYFADQIKAITILQNNNIS